jgi:hypothetical protein
LFRLQVPDVSKIPEFTEDPNPDQLREALSKLFGIKDSNQLAAELKDKELPNDFFEMVSCISGESRVLSIFNHSWRRFSSTTDSTKTCL